MEEPACPLYHVGEGCLPLLSHLQEQRWKEEQERPPPPHRCRAPAASVEARPPCHSGGSPRRVAAAETGCKSTPGAVHEEEQKLKQEEEEAQTSSGRRTSCMTCRPSAVIAEHWLAVLWLGVALAGCGLAGGQYTVYRLRKDWLCVTVYIFLKAVNRVCRDGKSLQDSTGKTLSLKNQRTKYVQKCSKLCKNTKNCTKKGKILTRVKNSKNCISVKN